MGRLETFGGKQMDGLAGLSFVMATVAFCGAQTREGGSHQIIDSCSSQQYITYT